VATIRDVAAKAGVSIKTVSRVINHDPAVRATTRELVEQVIAQLDYVPDPIARSLRGGRTGNVGVVTDAVVTTPHSVEIMSGIQDACAEMGLMVLIVNTKEQEAQERRAITTLIERKVEGIIYVTVRHKWLVGPPPVGDVPTVLVNCSVPVGCLLPAIVPDDFQGGYTATRHLIDRGHRDIALVSLIPTFEATQLRTQAYRQALEDHGLELDPQLVSVGQVQVAGRDVYTTDEAMLSIMKGPRRPSAIVCGKDEIAMRIYNNVRTMGLSIPDDISVVGYDNFVNVATNLDPPLTTIALPYYQMGRYAVQTLRRLSRGDLPDEMLLKVPCPLVERQSCRDW